MPSRSPTERPYVDAVLARERGSGRRERRGLQFLASCCAPTRLQVATELSKFSLDRRRHVEAAASERLPGANARLCVRAMVWSALGVLAAPCCSRCAGRRADGGLHGEGLDWADKLCAPVRHTRMDVDMHTHMRMHMDMVMHVRHLTHYRRRVVHRGVCARSLRCGEAQGGRAPGRCCCRTAC